jgi:CDP-glycerol glycerophosphotransferase
MSRSLSLRDGDTVLFESWRGRYGDSPRAISEELGRRLPGVRRFWSVSGDAELPPGVIPVRRGSAAYLYRLLTADLVVSNDLLPRHYRKPPWTAYLQTMHGTPLKRIGFDQDAPSFPGAAAYLKQLGRESRSWDLLLSAGQYTTDIYRRGFRYDGRILEAGAPRNDVLLSDRAPELVADIRGRMGLSSDQRRVVLYAPTWRDDDLTGTGSSRQRLLEDLDQIRALADRYVVLLRLHPLAAASLDGFADDDVIRNVSRWSDVHELFLVADLLVTDYSSVIFDFAVTRRPMLFLVPDLESYRDDLRGLYLDVENDLPGPLLRTMGDVVAAMDDLPAIEAQYSQRYERFVARHCPLEDGRAASRVVDELVASARGR